MEGTWKWVGGDAMGIHTVQVIFSWSLQAHVANHVIKFLVIKFLLNEAATALRGMTSLHYKYYVPAFSSLPSESVGNMLV